MTFEPAKAHILRRLRDAPIRRDPFAHLFVEEVFPAEVYAELVRRLPSDHAFVRFKDSGRVGADYSAERFAFAPAQLDRLADADRAFWGGLFAALLSAEFAAAVLDKFAAEVKSAAAELRIAAETCLMRDRPGYELGPHTDSPAKIASLLFYLAPDAGHPELGTSLYVPKDRRFFCAGGPHHPFHLFDRALTLPYRPNCLLAFPKTDWSFHGVEPVAPGGPARDLLFFDLRRL